MIHNLEEAQENFHGMNNLTIIRNSIKNHFSSIQPKVDHLTNTIFQILKEPFQDVLKEMKNDPKFEKYDIEIKGGLLSPHFDIKGNEIAPTYNLNVDIWYSLSVVVEDIILKKKRLWSLSDFISSEMQIALDKISKIVDLRLYPNFSVEKDALLVKFLEKHNLADRFSILSVDVVG